jgi:putative thioredoxin
MADSPHVVNVTAADFQRVVIDGSRQRPVLVDFWAEWCGPCRALMPVLAKLADEYHGKFLLAKVNTEQEQQLAQQFGIRSIPAVKLFRNGQVIDEFMGALGEREIRNFLEPHIPRESDKLAAQGHQYLMQGDVERAMQLLDAARQMDPENPRVILAYAQAQATVGDTAAAEKTLASLPPDEAAKPEVVAFRAQIHFDGISLKAPPPEDLERRLAANAGDSEARYQLAAHQVMAGQFEGALENLLTLLRKDRKYGEDTARKGLLMVFDILGSHPLVARYRSRMFNLLH